ncbi:hypothetical protein CDAR_616591 [Caerostris darwini]|uniref:Uncharacterized protein n=1 Tax=Caerostris darwini TaxID=1538125 RepID=A0AAV4VUN4_9ARAC|nr:hypothetical protein CDAR_616591 [Caerostris darwini]
MTHSEAKHPSFSTTGTDPPCFTYDEQYHLSSKRQLTNTPARTPSPHPHLPDFFPKYRCIPYFYYKGFSPVPPFSRIPVKPLPLRPSSSLHEEQPLSSEEGGGGREVFHPLPRPSFTRRGGGGARRPLLFLLDLLGGGGGCYSLPSPALLQNEEGSRVCCQVRLS